MVVKFISKEKENVFTGTVVDTIIENGDTAYLVKYYNPNTELWKAQVVKAKEIIEIPHENKNSVKAYIDLAEIVLEAIHSVIIETKRNTGA